MKKRFLCTTIGFMFLFGLTSIVSASQIVFTNGTTTNSGYNRTSAYNYANSHATSPSGNYHYYDEDCTNFVSQVLYAGNMGMQGRAQLPDCDFATSWFYYGIDRPQRSSSWTGAHAFKAHWASNGGSGNQRAYQYKLFDDGADLRSDWVWLSNNLKVGDVIQYVRKSDNDTRHTQVVFHKEYSYGQGRMIFTMAQHTGNSKTIDLWSYSQGTYSNYYIVVLRIKAGN